MDWMKKSWTCQTQISNLRRLGCSLSPMNRYRKYCIIKWTLFILQRLINQVIQCTTLVMLSSVVCTDVRTKGSLMSLMWKEAGVPGENPRVRARDHRTLSHTTTVEYGNRTRIAAQWKKRVHVLSNALLGQSTFYCLGIIHLKILICMAIALFLFRLNLKTNKK